MDSDASTLLYTFVIDVFIFICCYILWITVTDQAPLHTHILIPRSWHYRVLAQNLYAAAGGCFAKCHPNLHWLDWLLCCKHKRKASDDDDVEHDPEQIAARQAVSGIVIEPWVALKNDIEPEAPAVGAVLPAESENMIMEHEAEVHANIFEAEASPVEPARDEEKHEEEIELATDARQRVQLLQRKRTMTLEKETRPPVVRGKSANASRRVSIDQGPSAPQRSDIELAPLVSARRKPSEADVIGAPTPAAVASTSSSSSLPDSAMLTAAAPSATPASNEAVSADGKSQTRDRSNTVHTLSPPGSPPQLQSILRKRSNATSLSRLPALDTAVSPPQRILTIQEALGTDTNVVQVIRKASTVTPRSSKLQSPGSRNEAPATTNPSRRQSLSHIPPSIPEGSTSDAYAKLQNEEGKADENAANASTQNLATIDEQCVRVNIAIAINSPVASEAELAPPTKDLAVAIDPPSTMAAVVSPPVISVASSSEFPSEPSESPPPSNGLVATSEANLQQQQQQPAAQSSLLAVTVDQSKAENSASDTQKVDSSDQANGIIANVAVTILPSVDSPPPAEVTSPATASASPEAASSPTSDPAPEGSPDSSAAPKAQTVTIVPVQEHVPTAEQVFVTPPRNKLRFYLVEPILELIFPPIKILGANVVDGSIYLKSMQLFILLLIVMNILCLGILLPVHEINAPSGTSSFTAASISSVDRGSMWYIFHFCVAVVLLCVFYFYLRLLASHGVKATKLSTVITDDKETIASRRTLHIKSLPLGMTNEEVIKREIIKLLPAERRGVENNGGAMEILSISIFNDTDRIQHAVEKKERLLDEIERLEILANQVQLNPTAKIKRIWLQVLHAPNALSVKDRLALLQKKKLKYTRRIVEEIWRYYECVADEGSDEAASAFITVTPPQNAAVQPSPAGGTSQDVILPIHSTGAADSANPTSPAALVAAASQHHLRQAHLSSMESPMSPTTPAAVHIESRLPLHVSEQEKALSLSTGQAFVSFRASALAGEVIKKHRETRSMLRVRLEQLGYKRRAAKQTMKKLRQCVQQGMVTSNTGPHHATNAEGANNKPVSERKRNHFQKLIHTLSTFSSSDSSAEKDDEDYHRFWDITFAAKPSDILWDNLATHENFVLSHSRWLIGNASLISLVLFVGVPLLISHEITGIISSTTGAIDPNSLNGRVLTFVTNYLTTLTMWVINSYYSPYIMTKALDFECHSTKSSYQASRFFKQSLFYLVNMTLLPIFAFSTIKDLIQNISDTTQTETKWYDYLGNKFFTQSGLYFCQYFCHQIFVNFGFSLLDLPTYLKRVWNLRTALTQKDFETAKAPPGTGVGYDKLVAVFGLLTLNCLTVPLLLPFGLVYVVAQYNIDIYNLRRFKLTPALNKGVIPTLAARYTLLYFAAWQFLMAALFYTQNLSSYYLFGLLFLILGFITVGIYVFREFSTKVPIELHISALKHLDEKITIFGELRKLVPRLRTDSVSLSNVVQHHEEEDESDGQEEGDSDASSRARTESDLEEEYMAELQDEEEAQVLRDIRNGTNGVDSEGGDPKKPPATTAHEEDDDTDSDTESDDDNKKEKGGLWSAGLNLFNRSKPTSSPKLLPKLERSETIKNLMRQATLSRKSREQSRASVTGHGSQLKRKVTFHSMAVPAAIETNREHQIVDPTELREEQRVHEIAAAKATLHRVQSIQDQELQMQYKSPEPVTTHLTPAKEKSAREGSPNINARSLTPPANLSGAVHLHVAAAGPHHFPQEFLGLPASHSPLPATHDSVSTTPEHSSHHSPSASATHRQTEVDHSLLAIPETDSSRLPPPHPPAAVHAHSNHHDSALPSPNSPPVFTPPGITPPLVSPAVIAPPTGDSTHTSELLVPSNTEAAKTQLNVARPHGSLTDKPVPLKRTKTKFQSARERMHHKSIELFSPAAAQMFVHPHTHRAPISYAASHSHTVHAQLLHLSSVDQSLCPDCLYRHPLWRKVEGDEDVMNELKEWTRLYEEDRMRREQAEQKARQQAMEQAAEVLIQQQREAMPAAEAEEANRIREQMRAARKANRSPGEEPSTTSNYRRSISHRSQESNSNLTLRIHRESESRADEQDVDLEVSLTSAASNLPARPTPTQPRRYIDKNQ